MERSRKSILFFAIALLIMLFSGVATFLIGTNTAFAKTGTSFVVEKNEIEKVQIVTDGHTDLKVEQSANLKALVFPEIAKETIENISFSIVNGSQFAMLENDVLTIRQNASIGSKVEVKAQVDGVTSENSIVFTVVRTASELLEILNTETKLAQGDILVLETKLFPNTATNKELLYSITSGNEYVKVSQDGVISVNKQLPSNDLSFTVCVTSVSDPRVFASKTFELYIPVIDIISANGDLKEVEQQGKYSFKVDDTNLNEWNEVVYSVDVDESVATIDQEGTLAVSKTAEIGSKINVHIDVVGNNSYVQEVTVVPVYAENFVIVSQTKPQIEGAYLPGSVLEFEVEFPTPFNVSECNKVYSLQVSDSRLAFVDGNKVVIKNADQIIIENPGFIVTLLSNQNGKVLSKQVEINIHVPVTNVELIAKQQTLNQNSVNKISDLIETNVFPENSTNKFVTYELLENEFAFLQDDCLIVKDNLPVGELNLSIKAIAEGIQSNIVTFQIYKPTKMLSLSADNVNPISSIQTGEVVQLFTTTSENASENNPTITIIKGAENLEGNFENGQQLGSSLQLRKNLSQTLFDRQIVLKAEQDGVECELTLEVYIPNENFSLSVQPLQRGKFQTFEVTHSKNADETSWEIVDFDHENLLVSKSDQTIYVRQNASAGINVWVKLRACDRMKTEKTFNLTVAKMFENNAQTVNKFGIAEANSFTVEVDTDSEGVVLDKDHPQLFVGRSARIDVKFAGMHLSEYGLEFIRFETASESVDTNSPTVDSILVKQNASGKSYIDAKAIIRDGDTIYEVSIPRIYVFRPLKGSVKIKEDFEMISNGTDLKCFLTEGENFDFDATYDFSMFEFSSGSTTNDISITKDGIVTVVKADASPSQTVQIVIEEKYNGKKINDHPNYTATVTFKIHTVKVEDGGNYTHLVDVHDAPKKVTPTKSGYVFEKFYNVVEGVETVIYDSTGKLVNEHRGATEVIKTKWNPIHYKIQIYLFTENEKFHAEATYAYDQKFKFSPPGVKNWHFVRWSIGNKSNEVCVANDWEGSELSSKEGDTVKVYCVYEKDPGCVASGTKITLADGTQKNVEELESTDILLIWNLETGAFDVAPILFIDQHEEKEYVVTNLTFDDQTKVKVIDEHGFWDYDENRYVYITKENCQDFVGHWFNKVIIDENGMHNTRVQLLSAENVLEKTISWSPVTVQHMCYYVEGLLSVPSETQSFVNIFEVDSETMKINEEKKQADIETYGLFTYEDFPDVPPEIFDIFNGQYLKISIAKGLTTPEGLLHLIEKYSVILFEKEVM